MARHGVTRPGPADYEGVDMQQPTDPRLRQAAFQPGWLPLPEPPAKRSNAFLRGLTIVALGLAGAVGGFAVPVLLPVILFDVQAPDLGLGWLVPIWLGLAGGIWFGVRITSRNR
jgi:uncharacterized RDD family membrane protein YckC